MKNIQIFVLTVVLLFALNLQASVRLDGLGSYFSYLIPDLETDSDLFPSYLMEFENKTVQFSTRSQEYITYPGSDLKISLMPFLGKIRFKFDLQIGNDYYNNEIFFSELDSYNIRNNNFYSVLDDYCETKAVLKSAIAFPINELNLGAYFVIGTTWDDQIRNVEEPTLNYYDRSFEYDRNIIESGLNCNLGSVNVTLSYMDYIMNLNESFKYENISEFYPQHSMWLEEESAEQNRNRYRLSFSKTGLSKDASNRLYLDLSYKDLGLDYVYEYTDYDSVYIDYNLEIEIDKEEQLRHVIEDGISYECVLGFGKTQKFRKSELHFGFKLIGEYITAEREIEYFESDYQENIYQDSTTTSLETDEAESNYDLSRTKVNLLLPVGFTLHIMKNLELHGGLGLSATYKLIDFSNDDFNSSSISVSKSMGLSYSVLNKLDIDVNFVNSITSYSSWLVSLKYLY